MNGVRYGAVAFRKRPVGRQVTDYTA
jgi:hypothetical protein